MQVIGTPTTPAGPLDATGTWWGCAGGPGSPGCDTVAGAINSGSACSGVNCTTYPVVTASPVQPIMSPGPTGFIIRFSEDVRDLYGGFHSDDVTNTWNYLLVEDGVNGALDTDSCSDGAIPDDIQIAVDSAVYNALAYTVTIGINGGVPLPNGSYRLLVCGSTSVVDLSGVPLNGGADSIYDFVVGAGGVTALPATGFAPGQVTLLPRQPEALAYGDLGDLWLEIPRLGVQAPIVGVPASGGAWDVSWLANQAGWLQGTAFPTWAGNSAITGHVYDANGQPGPFQRLNQLWYGDRVVVHAFGQEYVYEVRQVRQVQPNDTSLVTHHEEVPWLTLLTCRGYDEATNSYRYRIVVRAVLVEVR
jgi:LPXTG-site transpeptidase (sortase) family protein